MFAVFFWDAAREPVVLRLVLRCWLKEWRSFNDVLIESFGVVTSPGDSVVWLWWVKSLRWTSQVLSALLPYFFAWRKNRAGV